MPAVDTVLYQEINGRCPFIEWTNSLSDELVEKLVGAVEDLERDGWALPRPTADTLRDGIHELRVRHYNVHYRILYFFHGRVVAVVSHGLAKTGRVPDKDIDTAIERKRRFEGSPELHTYRQPDDDD